MRAAIIVDGKVDNIIEVDSLDAIEGVQLVEAPGAAIGDLWDGETFTREEAPPAPPTREQLKQARQAAVDAITVTVNDKVFDGDETSQGRMARALRVAEITGQTSCTWVLHDNTAVEVTRDELAQALALAMQAQGAIWVIPA
jgi:hypothetical protein